MANCGACDLGLPHICDKQLSVQTPEFNFKFQPFEHELVDSKNHNHQIVPWAVEEKCYSCNFPASHKVVEDYFNGFHPLTAYVCCDHFWGGCSNVT